MSEGDDRADDARAFKRYLVLNLVRIAGVALVLVGIAVMERLISLPPVLAYILVIAGFLAFFFGPGAIAKGWRSDQP